MKVQGWFAAVCFLLFSAVAFSASAADDSQPVGNFGQPSSWAIEGTKTFSPAEIRSALLNELDVVAACETGEPLDGLTQVIAAKLTAGYQSAGFPDVKVTVATAEGKLTAAIDEGDRYGRGAVKISGAKVVDVDKLTNQLTTGDGLGSGRPAWSADEPASFNTEYQNWLTTKVAELLADQGFYRPTLKVVVEPDRESRTATLTIDILDAGPSSTLADVEISGNSSHSREDLFTYLAVEAQAPLTKELRRQIEHRLQRSGRLLRVGWKLDELEQRGDDWQPKLSLREYPLAPPLAALLTPEEVALLKLAEWVEKFDESGDELLVRFPQQHVSLVFAPRHGFIVAVEPPIVLDGQNGDGGFLSAVVMAEERVGLYSRMQRRKIDAAPPPAPIMGNAAITLVDGQPALSGRGSLTAGVGLRRTASKALRRHVQMHLRLSAAAALSVVRTHDAKATWEGEVVCFEWKHRRMKVDSRTGRLIEQIADAASDEGKADPDDAHCPHITLAPGEFNRRLAEIENASADWPNAADDHRPLSCLAEFLCREAERYDLQSKDGYAAVGKLFEHGLLTPFDKLISQMAAPDEGGFAIPYPYFSFHFNSLPELLAQRDLLVRLFAVRLGHALLPPGSWLESVWCHGALLLTDRRRQASDELACQPADGNGAVCALASAEMLRAADMPELSQLCARRGLRRLSLAAFQGDCRGLVSDHGVLSECLLHITSAVRALDDNDVEAIVALLDRFALLDEPQADVLKHFVAALRTDKTATTTQATSNAFDGLWRSLLSDWVKQRLQTLAAPVEPSPLADVSELPDPLTYPGPPPARPAPPLADIPTYRAALPGEIPGYLPGDYFPIPKHEPGAEPEPAKSLKQEVLELKWLAMGLTDRLKKLEQRLESEAAGTAENPPAAAMLDGYCCVTLVEKRRWQVGRVEYGAVQRGRTYLFVDRAAQQAFLKDPARYCPVLNGNDPVLAVDKGQIVPGLREHGAFYQGRVFLFANEKNFQEFDRSPERYLASPQLSADAALKPFHGGADLQPLHPPHDAPAPKQATAAERADGAD
ncbi:MAG TPA: hypothetical protein VFI31_21060 [Pirellulales bacterium]|nr:hypothetical protein [Pirellulales bacterium]